MDLRSLFFFKRNHGSKDQCSGGSEWVKQNKIRVVVFQADCELRGSGLEGGGCGVIWSSRNTICCQMLRVSVKAEVLLKVYV